MDLGYLNARVRGYKGRLLKEADYDQLIEADATESLMDRLLSTGYGPNIAVAAAPWRGAAGGGEWEDEHEVLERALRSNMAATIERLSVAAPAGAGALMKAVLSLMEVHNLKTLIRGIDRGKTSDDIFGALLPAGEFDIAALKLLVGSKDVPTLVGMLETWGSIYAVPLKGLLDDYQKRRKLFPIELALDRYSITHFLKTLKKKRRMRKRAAAIISILSARADRANVMTLLKCVREGFTEDDLKGLFIEGGRLMSMEEFLVLSGIEVRAELLNELTVRLKERDPAVSRVLFNADPAELYLLEERLQDASLRGLLKEALIEPESLALYIWYIQMKSREIKNIRLIARCKRFKVPAANIKGMLFYPALS